MRLQPLEPRRVRYPRGAYGWVDLRVVTNGFIERLGPKTALTYLFLCSVGNTQGLSCWSRQRISQVLGLNLDDVDGALLKLTAADLVASNGRVVQVLPIGDSGVTRRPPRSSVDSQRPSPPPGIVRDEFDDSEISNEVSEDEILAHEPAARLCLAKIQQTPRLDTIRRVARSFALIKRRATEQHSMNGALSRG
jgi:hypothetical protein